MTIQVEHDPYCFRTDKRTDGRTERVNRDLEDEEEIGAQQLEGQKGSDSKWISICTRAPSFTVDGDDGDDNGDKKGRRTTLLDK